MTVTWRKENDIGFVEMDNPPVNAIGVAMRQGLLDAARWAEAENLERVILSGAGRAFAAGADAKEFDAKPLDPQLPDVLNTIEQGTVPWIAVIEGVALGGGAEVAMACRQRIMSPGSQIGLPEVTLGVIPGAGGTQRLPRLVGLQQALTLIATGKPANATDALAMGWVDAVEENPHDAAFMVNTEALHTTVPVSELPTPALDAAVVEAARALAAKKTPGQIAPQRAIDVIEKGLSMDFMDATQLERETFLERKDSDQARALRYLFFAERAARAPKHLAALVESGDPLVNGSAHIGVIGGGTMGAGISYALLSAGYRVTIVESGAEAIERATQNVDRIVDASLKRGLIDDAVAQERRGRLAITSGYDSLSDVRLVVEAVFESMDVKCEVFSRLQAVVPPDALLASNTSYLNINQLAEVVSGPERVLGLHFFAPAYIMRLLEIVQADKTSDAVLAASFALAKRLRKVPVVSGVCDGFIGNRILARYREATDTLMLDGSTPWEIDEAMIEFGYPMGPYEAQDLSGLDISHANRRREDATRDPNRRYIPIGDRMVEQGRLGRKTGVGWYRYPDGVSKVEDPVVADVVLEEAHFAKVSRTEYSADTIRERSLLAMINEACDILYEGIAASARDIDLVSVFGYAFPRYRGGLMHYADTIGVDKIIEGLEALATEDALVWKISPLLKDCQAKQIKIAEWTPASS